MPTVSCARRVPRPISILRHRAASTSARCARGRGKPRWPATGSRCCTASRSAWPRWRARSRALAMQVWLERTRARWLDLDRRWATACHRIANFPLVVLALVRASRLADGPLWYALIALLLLVGGRKGAACGLQMLGVGLLNLTIYRTVKQRTC